MSNCRGHLTMENGNNETQGIVFEIQRWSTNDGPGIRTVVFLKGCPLSCLWCANPESWVMKPQIAIFPDKCTNCRYCEEACPQAVALPAAENGFNNRIDCIACGQCLEACYSNARELIGKHMTTGEVIKQIKKDMIFYTQSGGGITLSGGEPLLQPEFVRSILRECNVLGLSTIIETCGYFSWEENKDILKQMKLIFLDIKHMDTEIHKCITGTSNKKILENACKISQEKIPLVIRIPIIPSINDSIVNIKATAKFVRENLVNALGIELLPYHELGKGKYKSLGLKYNLDDIKPPDNNEMERLKTIIRETGINVLKY